jgi:hypothetical protein
MGRRSKAFVMLVGVAVAGVLSDGGGAEGTKTAVAQALLLPSADSEVRGVGVFRQRGPRLSGVVVVWGLAPKSRHAVHFHGPNGSCARGGAPPIAAHADLVAAENGVAFARFVTTTRIPVVRRGIYYNVHANPTTAGENPEIACGDLVRLG